MEFYRGDRKDKMITQCRTGRCSLYDRVMSIDMDLKMLARLLLHDVRQWHTDLQKEYVTA